MVSREATRFFTATKDGAFDAVYAFLVAEPVLLKETNPQESAPEFFELLNHQCHSGFGDLGEASLELPLQGLVESTVTDADLESQHRSAATP